MKRSVVETYFTDCFGFVYERVKNNEMWSLFCPHNINHALEDIYGDEFVQVYEQLEREKKYVKQVKAQELWFAICRSQIETGTPYIVYKDAVNRKTNQQKCGCYQIQQFVCFTGHSNSHRQGSHSY